MRKRSFEAMVLAAVLCAGAAVHSPWMASAEAGTVPAAASAAAAAMGAAVAAEDQKPPITLDEFFDSVSYPSVRVSPDGNAVVIETDRAEKKRGQQDAAGGHGNPRRQDEFAAALDPVRERLDLRLQAHDLLVRVAVIHACSLPPSRATPNLS